MNRQSSHTTIAQQLRKRQVAGLVIILAIILALSIYHAGIHNVFPHGWWHIW